MFERGGPKERSSFSRRKRRRDGSKKSNEIKWVAALEGKTKKDLKQKHTHKPQKHTHNIKKNWFLANQIEAPGGGGKKTAKRKEEDFVKANSPKWEVYRGPS